MLAVLIALVAVLVGNNSILRRGDATCRSIGYLVGANICFADVRREITRKWLPISHTKPSPGRILPHTILPYTFSSCKTASTWSINCSSQSCPHVVLGTVRPALEDLPAAVSRVRRKYFSGSRMLVFGGRKTEEKISDLKLIPPLAWLPLALTHKTRSLSQRPSVIIRDCQSERRTLWYGLCD